MYRSAIRYARLISANLLSDDRKVILRDLKRHVTGKRLVSDGIPIVTKSLDQAAAYLMRARMNSPDGGFGSYHLGSGWGPSYPETSGYIIPTLFDYYRRKGDEGSRKAAFGAAEWLLEIQKPSGGWQGGRIGEGKPEVIFNTGQVVRGMVSAYQESGDERFLVSAVRACDWLAEQQEADGSWKKHALMESQRVYDSFVDVPLLQVWQVTDEKKYLDAAVKNLDWIVHQKRRENGWFEDCDNTVKHNDRPIIHTIAYTIDGLIDSGVILNAQEYIQAGKKAADMLREDFTRRKILKGRYDDQWNGSEHFICTGGAQMAIAWLKIDRIHPNEGYFYLAEKMLSLLSYVQIQGDNPAKGALTGSYPVWGRYEPFACPNWATKFFMDALMQYLESDHLNSL